MRALVALLMCSLCACSLDGDRFLIKVLENDDITVTWYYYSYITSPSPEFIEMSNGDEVAIIYKSSNVVTDIRIEDKTLVIMLFKPERDMAYTKNIKKEFYGYRITLDSTATHDDFLNIPNAIRE